MVNGQSYCMIDDGWQVFVIVRDYDKGAAGLLQTVTADDIGGFATVLAVEAVVWFVEDQQGRVFDKGSAQQHPPLFSA